MHAHNIETRIQFLSIYVELLVLLFLSISVRSSVRPSLHLSLPSLYLSLTHTHTHTHTQIYTHLHLQAHTHTHTRRMLSLSVFPLCYLSPYFCLSLENGCPSPFSLLLHGSFVHVRNGYSHFLSVAFS